MRRFVWSHTRFNGGRSVALILAVVAAVASFVVLSGSAREQSLQVVGTTKEHFKSAYNILVRPKDSRSPLETAQGLVQPDFMSGLFGGITLAQWHKIETMPGVDVAAPVAMVGYVMPQTNVPIDLSALLGDKTSVLVRVADSWTTDRGTSRIPGDSTYLYLTKSPIIPSGPILGSGNSSGLTDSPDLQVVDGKKVPVCAPFNKALLNSGPAKPVTDFLCVSTTDYQDTIVDLGGGKIGLQMPASVPFLVAAIDPVQEAKLDGLDAATASGRYLAEGSGARQIVLNGSLGSDAEVGIPVLAATSTDLDDSMAVEVSATSGSVVPAGLELDQANLGALAALPWSSAKTVSVPEDTLYQQMLETLAHKPGVREAAENPFGSLSDSWSVGQTRWSQGSAGALVAPTVRNPDSVWSFAGSKVKGNVPWYPVPDDNSDVQTRVVTERIGHGLATKAQLGSGPLPALVPVLQGTFDPSKVRRFDPLSRVPLSIFSPTVAVPADAASAAALGGRALLPNGNIGGPVAQPVQLVTTLASLSTIEKTGLDRDPGAPISSVRVRVAGVVGADALSRERVRAVAQRIETETGLDVDIVAGSSPAPTTIDIPAGKYGRPGLALSENWVKKGVALAIVQAIDTKSLVLFALVLIVCALFVFNATSAALRSRRGELAVLVALGWPPRRVMTAVMTEVALLGVAAGVLGAAVAIPLGHMFGLHVSVSREALAVPVALALCLLGSYWPCLRASRTPPAQMLRPAGRAPRRAARVRSVLHLGALGVARVPGRAALGVLSLAVGIAALTVLVAADVVFRNAVVGSLLGNVVSLQVHGVDEIAVGAIVVLAVACVADILFLSLRERSAEIAALVATGWGRPQIVRLVAAEACVLGVVGALLGAGAGLALAVVLAGSVPASLVLTGVATCVIGIVLVLSASVLPALGISTLRITRLLAEEN